MSQPVWGTFAEGDEVIWRERTRGEIIGLDRGGLVMRVIINGGPLMADMVVNPEDLRHANELVRFAREIQ